MCVCVQYVCYFSLSISLSLARHPPMEMNIFAMFVAIVVLLLVPLLLSF